MTTQSQIHLNSVKVSYPLNGGGRKVIFEDLSLEIADGEFVTFVGPSGSGKSTILRLILGSQFPNQGLVTVSDKKVEHVERTRGIVYQKYSLFPNMSVLDNIAIGYIWENTTLPQRMIYTFFPEWIFHKHRYYQVLKKARKMAMEYLLEIGLSKADAQKRPGKLSGGMRQRVAIAQALMMKPDVLLMDEPFGALDYSTREDMQAFLLEQRQKHGMTVIFVTHDLDEALFLGTRLIAISQYFTDESGNQAESSRFVCDIDLSETLGDVNNRQHDVKFSTRFSRLKQRVQQQALDPSHLQHLESFSSARAKQEGKENV